MKCSQSTSNQQKGKSQKRFPRFPAQYHTGMDSSPGKGLAQGKEKQGFPKSVSQPLRTSLPPSSPAQDPVDCGGDLPDPHCGHCGGDGVR